MPRIAFTVLLCLVSVSAFAQGGQGTAIPWERCPCEGALGSVAKISIPEGFVFVGENGVKEFLTATQNPSDGDELGVLAPVAQNANWFVLFSFQQTGYIKDDEGANLDADAILESIRKGTAASNEERRKQGWSPLEITGWQRKPFYDAASHNLTWGIGATSDGDPLTNYNVRLLGRRGVVSANLVGDPTEVTAAASTFNDLLRGFEFTTGNRYAEFVQGDQVAAYGLTALVAGGAGAALAKSGLLAKFWKVIVVGVVALAGAIKKAIAALLGKRAPDPAGEGVNG